MSTCWHAPLQPKWHNRFNPLNLKLKCLFSSFKKERTALWLKLPTVAFKVFELKKKKKVLYFYQKLSSPHKHCGCSTSGWQIELFTTVALPSLLPLFPGVQRPADFEDFLLFHSPLQTLAPFRLPAVASLKLLNCTQCPLYTTLVATGYWVFRYV